MPRVKDEWPLTFFTVFAPAAVGAGVVLSWRFNKTYLDPLIFPASLVLFGTIAFAFVISSVHIGRKLRMPRAILNLFRSWLSREIFLMSASCVIYLVTATLFYFRDDYNIEDRYIKFLFWGATGVGILGILAVQRVYLLRSVKLWTSSRAISLLFSSASLIGFMEAALIINIFAGESVSDVIWKHIHLLSIPVFFDVIQLNELRRIHKSVTAIFFACLKLVPYVILVQLSGRVEMARLLIALGLALTGDLIVRFSFFNEYTTSFKGEINRARLSRLTTPTAPGFGNKLHGSGGRL